MGESYNHKDDPGIMLKLYPIDWTRLAEKEYDRAVKAFALGVSTPEAKDLVKVPDGRMGIIFQRIQGKKSFARAVGDDPSRTEELATRFATLCKTLHSTRVNKEELPSTETCTSEMPFSGATRVGLSTLGSSGTDTPFGIWAYSCRPSTILPRRRFANSIIWTSVRPSASGRRSCGLIPEGTVP